MKTKPELIKELKTIIADNNSRAIDEHTRYVAVSMLVEVVETLENINGEIEKLNFAIAELRRVTDVLHPTGVDEFYKKRWNLTT